MKVEYTRTFTFSGVREVKYTRKTYWWKPRQLPSLTDEELDSVPESFRCYVCGDTHKKAEFGGHLVFQRICKICYPWVDDSKTGFLIRWDERRGFRQSVRILSDGLGKVGKPIRQRHIFSWEIRK